MVNAEHYIYKVIWSEEDQEHVGLCAEFPSLSYLDGNMKKTLDGIINLVKDVLVDMEENGEDIPQPISHKHFSGKFQVRVNPDRHRKLAIEAAEKGISLNRLASDKLAE